MKSLRLKKGFTLTEILIAAVILLVALCSVLAAFASCAVLSSTSKNVNGATNLALGLLENMRSIPYSDIENNTSFFQDSVQQYISNYDYVNFPANSSVSVAIDDETYAGLLQVIIGVSWVQDNRNIGPLQFITLRASR